MSLLSEKVATVLSCQTLTADSISSSVLTSNVLAATEAVFNYVETDELKLSNNSVVSAPAFLTPFQFQGFPQDTNDVSSIGPFTIAPGVFGRWGGGVLAPNGKIYGIPNGNNSVLIIDPVTNTADDSTIQVPVGSSKWDGGVLAPNGKIYGIPFNSPSVLIIDPETNTADTTTIQVPAFGGWLGGVLAPNGKIYGIPNASNKVLIIDPSTNTVDYNTITLGGSGNRGGVLGSDGKIYTVPGPNATSNAVYIIDPNTNTVNTITGLQLGTQPGSKWTGGALGADGKIYMAPYSYSSVLIIDPFSPIIDITSSFGIVVANVSYTNSSSTLNCPGASLLTSGLTAGDNIIITTATNSYTGYIQSLTATTMTFYSAIGVDITTSTITKLEKTRKADFTSLQMLFGEIKFFGLVLGQNGKLYGITYDYGQVLVINPSSPIIDITSSYGIVVANVSYQNAGSILNCPGASLLTAGLLAGDNIIITTATKSTYTGYIQSFTNTTITFTSGFGVNILAPTITKIEKTQKISLIPLAVPGIRYGFFGGVLAPNGIIYGMPYVHNYVLQIRTGLPTLQPWMLEAYFNKY
jgi:hypothetical protein